MKIAILAGLSLLVLFTSCSSRNLSSAKPLLEAETTPGAASQEAKEKSAQEESESSDKSKSFFDVADFGPQVVPFTTEQAAQELAKSQTVVYYFTATWCDECQETYKDLQVSWKTIPANFTLVFVNYDKEQELKKKYGVTTQHSFVVIGPAGEKKKIWAGTVPVAEIVEIATRA